MNMYGEWKYSSSRVTHDTHWIGGCVGPTAGLGTVESDAGRAAHTCID
jgi:hypothetical protein